MVAPHFMRPECIFYVYNHVKLVQMIQCMDKVICGAHFERPERKKIIFCPLRMHRQKHHCLTTNRPMKATHSFYTYFRLVYLFIGQKMTNNLLGSTYCRNRECSWPQEPTTKREVEETNRKR